MSKNRNAPPSKKTRKAEVEAKKAKQRRNLLIIGGVILALIVALAVWQVVSNANSETVSSDVEPGAVLEGERPLATLLPSARNEYFTAPPEMVIDPAKDYQAVIQTEKGDIRLQLFAAEAPQTVNNFVYLANQGYYDDTTFHRVIDGFMAQAGDPLGLGYGGPGYAFADEVDNGLTFDRRGLLAMANSGPNTNGSQFFITLDATPHLNGDHTIFGEVIEGDDVLAAITVRDPMSATTPGDLIEQIIITEQ